MGEAVIQTLAVDRVLHEIAGAFEEAGIRPILLKGPSIAAWLYPEGDRRYTDCDLLVGPGDWAGAERVLASLGYVSKLAGMRQSERETHSVPWHKPGAAVEVDLHRSLPGARAGHDVVWRTLSRETSSQTFGSRNVDVLNHAALALHIVLHAAEDGLGNPQVAEDLRRALDVADQGEWKCAAALAGELGARESFLAGLLLTTAGVKMAGRLHLDGEVSPSVALRAAGHPATAVGVAAIFNQESTAARVRLLLSKVFPSPAFMRRWYSSPLAWAYLRRWVWILRKGPSGYRRWNRARHHEKPAIKDPVKLLMYSWAMAPSVGGVERLSDVMARHLDEVGYEVRVMTATQGPLPHTQYQVLREPGFFQLINHVRWADVIHFNTFNARVLLVALLTRTPVVWQHIDYDTISPRGLCYRMGHPCQGHIGECYRCLRQDHSPAQTVRPWLSLMAKRWGKRLVKRNLISSQYAGEKLKLAAAEMVTFGIETDKFPFRERDGGEKPLSVLFCARHIPGKGCDVLLRALALCRDDGVEFQATIAGDGPTRAASEALAAKLDIDDSVRFVGHLSDADLVQALQQSDVTAIPTLQDEIGQLVALEALSSGSCVCVSDIGAFREQLDGVALLFQPGNAKALAEHLGALANDRELRRRLSRAGRRLAEERFDVAQMTGRYDQIFRQVTGNAQ